MSERDVQWTAKAPALIAGLVAIVLSMVATARGRMWLAGILLVLAIAFITYSFTLKEWCEVHQHGWGAGAFGRTGFGGSIGECIREKGWFTF